MPDQNKYTQAVLRKLARLDEIADLKELEQPPFMMERARASVARSKIFDPGVPADAQTPFEVLLSQTPSRRT